MASSSATISIKTENESNRATRKSTIGDPQLLDKIDKLFELNIGEYVALPQLLVVGDQSSGKSSVLEGLTDLPFPRDSGLCTRFATQITFRRSPHTSVAVTIIPGPDAESKYADELRGWRADLTSLDRDAFSSIVKEVYGLMGLSETQVAPDKVTKTFSNDVLKIEILGPGQAHLSIIDVPGIFKKTTAGLTTKADIEMVRAMVLSYMMNERSIMLAVIPANVDIATQEILELAEGCDPSGRRTLGVLTKPDLVDKGAEHAIISIVEGRIHPLNLGWCVVRNAGQQDLTKASGYRQSIEQVFFKTQEPWTKLVKDRVGIESLRSRLVEILADMVNREFSKVKSDISGHLKTKKKELSNLGPARATRDQQYKFVLNIATCFQSITASALKADYGDHDIFDDYPTLRIATEIMDRNATFSDDMFERGHTRAFKVQGAPMATLTVSPVPAPAPEAAIVDSSPHKLQPDSSSAAGQKSSRQRGSPFNELEDVLTEAVPMAEPSSEPIIPWLTKVYKSSRGFELGTFDASLLPIVWKKQSTNWDPLALGYVSDIVLIVHGFNIQLLTALCDDERVAHELFYVLLDELLERYRKAMNHARFLLEVERDGTPLTTNHYFAENLEKSRQERVKARLGKDSYKNSEGVRVVNLDTTIASTTASNLEHTIGDLHDILHSYYKVARKRFVDVVCMQAADYHLITGPDTPIKVFSPKFVSELSNEQLQRIAGEGKSVERRRTQLTRDVENLEKGMKVLM